MHVLKISTAAIKSSLGWVLAAIFSVGAVWSCQGGGQATGEEQSAKPATAEQAAEPTHEEAAPEPTGKPGTIKVTVKFEGPSPKMKQINRQADPFCAKTKRRDESVLLNKDGTLKNVAIKLDKVRGQFAVPSEPIKIMQHECMYEPRVQTAMMGQKIEIANGDMTLHNVHTYKGEKQANWFNRAQPPKAPIITETFPKDGVVTFKCDVHPWMAGHVVLADHPFAGITGDAGLVTLTDVPSKKKAYTVVAWHERYGEQKTKVVVEAGKTAEVIFTYKADQIAN